MADVSRETWDDLAILEALLLKWNKRINLIARGSEAEIRARHIKDSLQLLPLIPKGASLVDLGSGGGFPALPIAILSKHTGLTRSITLIESDHRKSAFLRTAILELDLPATVITARIEDANPQAADLCTARALAPCDKLFAYAARHLSSTGMGLFLKGENAPSELVEARERWHFDLETHPSATHPTASILKVRNLRRV